MTRMARAALLALALAAANPASGRSQADPGTDPLAGVTLLARGPLIRAVLERNPGLESARQAWRATIELRERADALEDPMLSLGLAPLSIGSDDVRFGAVVEFSQLLPWSGKRGVRRAVADAESRETFERYEVARLELAKLASDLFDELRVNATATGILRHHAALLEDLKHSAESRYVVGKASQQDPLEAEVMLADVLREEAMLRGAAGILTAEINTLLRRDPLAALPPVPVSVPFPELPAESLQELTAAALAARPELNQAEARLQAAEATTELAHKEFRPDMRVTGQYSSMWAETEHQWMAGVSFRLPVRRANLHASLRESEARVAESDAWRSRLHDQVRLDVALALENVTRSVRVAEILRDRLLPASRDQVEAARAGFETGMSSFSALILAENRLRDASLDYEKAVAELYRSLAALDRATGRVPFLHGEELP